MFKFLLDKLSGVIGGEAERQNAIARFGTGIAIDMNGNIDDPRNPGKKMPVDDFSKMAVKDQLNAIAPTLERAQAKQIKPEDINFKTAVDLMKSSFSSDDAAGKKMREDRVANFASGHLMSTLKGKDGQEPAHKGLKM